MKNSALHLTAGLALLIAASANVQSQSVAVTPAPPPSDWDKLSNEIKNPASWFSWGGDLRLRNEYLNNALTLSPQGANNEQSYYRYRERVWASFKPVTGLSLNARLTGEQRDWSKVSFASQYARTGFEERYGILDSCNIKYDNIADSGVSAAVGRQDIMLGDPLNWWLVADGTPGDGSWTFFLDSARVTYEAKPIKTKFDFIYINQKAMPDERFPTIGRSSGNVNPVAAVPQYRPYTLTEQNEEGVIVYVTTKAVKNMQIDGYIIYKHDERIPEIANGDNADIYTLGAKFTGTPIPNIFYSLEGAYQFGWKEDTVRDGTGGAPRFASRSMDAYGVNGKVTYLFKDKLDNQISLVGEYLSGDDPNTPDTDEMFDVLWGRWPRWSDLYIFSYVHETGGKIAQMNNTYRLGVSYSIAPVKRMKFSTMYNALFAPQADPSRATGAGYPYFSHDGHFRGHYLQSFLKYQFNKHLSAGLLGEFLWEGDFYAQNDLMTFTRIEMMITF